jgi:hypothetical protein
MRIVSVTLHARFRETRGVGGGLHGFGTRLFDGDIGAH